MKTLLICVLFMLGLLTTFAAVCYVEYHMETDRVLNVLPVHSSYDPVTKKYSYVDPVTKKYYESNGQDWIERDTTGVK